MSSDTANTELTTAERPVPEAQADAIRGLPQHLKPFYEQLGSVIGRHIQTTLITNYQIGEILADAQAEMWRRAEQLCAEEKHAEKAIDFLAGALGVSARFLYRCRQVVAKFSREEYQELITTPLLSWTHVVHLLRVDSDALQAEALALLQDKQLTADQFDVEIRKRSGRQPSKPGRPRPVPTDASTGLMQMSTEVSRVLKSLDEIWMGERYDIANELLRPSRFHLNQQTADRLSHGIEVLEIAADFTQRAADRLKTTRETLEEQRQEETAAEAAEEDE